MRSFYRTALVFALALVALTNRGHAQDAQSRLWDAAIAGDTAAVRKAVVEGARVDSIDFRTNRNGRLALNWAAWYDHVDVVKLLIALKAPVNGTNLTGFTALHHAAEHGSTESARALLEAGADPDVMTQSSMTASQIARMKGNDATAVLIENAPRKKPSK